MIQTSYSTRTSPDAACQELRTSLAGDGPRLVLYFASPVYDPAEIAAAMQASFPDATLVGCTTAGEIAAGRMLKQSIVAMAIPQDIVPDVHIEVIEGLSQGAGVGAALEAFEVHFGERIAAMDIQKYVGVVLIDGLSRAEERLMEQVSDLCDLTFIGGSAGDDLAFKATHVFANGRAYTDAAVLALLKTPRGFTTIKTQSFHATPQRLTATRVDETTRTVMEFNGQPAAKAYAGACGVPVADVADAFMRSPLGLMVDDEPYVRSPQQVRGTDIVFYCNIRQGSELTVLASDDIVADTRASVQTTVRELDTLAGLINFHCILRTLELDHKGESEHYGRLFAGLPAIGFSTYGEAYIGHINQTSTMLVLR